MPGSKKYDFFVMAPKGVGDFFVLLCFGFLRFPSWEIMGGHPLKERDSQSTYDYVQITLLTISSLGRDKSWWTPATCLREIQGAEKCHKCSSLPGHISEAKAESPWFSDLMSFVFSLSAMHRLCKAPSNLPECLWHYHGHILYSPLIKEALWDCTNCNPGVNQTNSLAQYLLTGNGYRL